GAAEHVIEPAELPRALDRYDILRLFDDADDRAVAARVAADPTGVLFGDVAAHLAEAHLLTHDREDLGEPGRVEALGLEDVEGDALRRPRTDAGELAERLVVVLAA